MSSREWNADIDEIRQAFWRRYEELRAHGRDILDNSCGVSESLGSGSLAVEVLHRLTSQWDCSGRLHFDVQDQRQFLAAAAAEIPKILKQRQLQRQQRGCSDSATTAVPLPLSLNDFRQIFAGCDGQQPEWSHCRVLLDVLAQLKDADPAAAEFLEQYAVLRVPVWGLADLAGCSETAYWRRLSAAMDQLNSLLALRKNCENGQQ